MKEEAAGRYAAAEAVADTLLDRLRGSRWTAAVLLAAAAAAAVAIILVLPGRLD